MKDRSKLSVLIVDDEPLVRTGLKSILERVGPEFSLERILEAEDGSRAIEILENDPVDLVFSDIVMPKIDGLTLLAWISANRPECKTIVLSCHDDYKYVRGSFNHNILDYILKYDIDSETVRNTLAKVSNRPPGKAERYKAQKTVHPSVVLLTEALDACREDLKPGSLFQLLVIQSDSGRVSANLIEHTLAGLLNRNVNPIYLHLQASTHGVLIESPAGLIKGELTTVAEQLANTVTSAAKTELTIIVNPVPRNKDTLRSLFDEAGKQINERFFNGPGIYWTDSKENTVASDIHHTVTAMKAAVFKDLYDKNISCLKKRLQEFGSFVRRGGGLSEQLVKDTYIEFLDLIAMFYHDELPYSNTEELQQIRIHIENATFLSTVITIFESIFIEISKSAALVAHPGSLSVGIRRALVYIHSHYTSPNLSLADVAEELNYSHSYLSRQFKKEIGSNIVAYINELRLKEARRFLATGKYLIYEVAGLVGFNNYNYFSKLYKNFFGVSPNQDTNNIAPTPES